MKTIASWLTLVCGALAVATLPARLFGQEAGSAPLAEDGSGSSAVALPREKPVHEMTELDLAEYIPQLHASGLSPPDRVGAAALRSVGQPYRAAASMFDQRESDCVTFVERTLIWGSHF